MLPSHGELFGPAKPPSQKDTPCRLTKTTYYMYMRLLSISVSGFSLIVSPQKNLTTEKCLHFIRFSGAILCNSPESALKTPKSTSDEPTAETTVMRVNGYVQAVVRILEEIARCLITIITSSSDI